MANLPYVSSPGNIDKALTGIKQAAVPEAVSQDFVKTILKIPGGSGDQMTSFLKKLGLANPDGSPNELYRRFRNPTSSGGAMAVAIRNAYAPLFVRNEYAHRLSDADLIGLVVEETGLAHDASSVRQIVSCFRHLRNFADFEQIKDEAVELPRAPTPAERLPSQSPPANQRSFGLNLGYTINLNLPATTDPAVFDAIFKSIKQNLLSEDNG
jgi:hypothetical protein